MSKLIDLTGQKFGKLTVQKLAYTNNKAFWECICDCGNKKIVSTSDLKCGKVKSCGCLWIKHNKTKTKLYQVWCSMRARCYRPSHSDYYLYGARGIKICEEWLVDYMNFYNWAISNGYKEDLPPKTLSLDRINVDGNYEPHNCRWVTLKKQANNTRRNHYITLENETHTISEWAEIYNINSTTIQKRLKKGWDVFSAVTMPVRKMERNKEQ